MENNNKFGINKQGDVSFEDDGFTPKKLDRISFTVDFQFWAILPLFSLNLHFPEIEFEWLCFGIYLRIGKL